MAWYDIKEIVDNGLVSGARAINALLETGNNVTDVNITESSNISDQISSGLQGVVENVVPVVEPVDNEMTTMVCPENTPISDIGECANLKLGHNYFTEQNPVSVEFALKLSAIRASDAAKLAEKLAADEMLQQCPVGDDFAIDRPFFGPQPLTPIQSVDYSGIFKEEAPKFAAEQAEVVNASATIVPEVVNASVSNVAASGGWWDYLSSFWTKPVEVSNVNSTIVSDVNSTAVTALDLFKRAPECGSNATDVCEKICLDVAYDNGTIYGQICKNTTLIDASEFESANTTGYVMSGAAALLAVGSFFWSSKSTVKPTVNSLADLPDVSEAVVQGERERELEAKRAEEAAKQLEVEAQRKADEVAKVEKVAKVEVEVEVVVKPVAVDVQAAEQRELEAQRKADEAKRAQEAEQRRQGELADQRKADEAKRVQEAEQRRQRELEAQRAEEAAKQLEVEAQRKVEEVAKVEVVVKPVAVEREAAEQRELEAQRKADEAKRAQEAEQRRQRELADQRKADEAKRAQEAGQRKLREQAAANVNKPAASPAAPTVSVVGSTRRRVG